MGSYGFCGLPYSKHSILAYHASLLCSMESEINSVTVENVTTAENSDSVNPESVGLGVSGSNPVTNGETHGSSDSERENSLEEGYSGQAQTALQVGTVLTSGDNESGTVAEEKVSSVNSAVVLIWGRNWII